MFYSYIAKLKKQKGFSPYAIIAIIAVVVIILVVIVISQQPKDEIETSSIKNNQTGEVITFDTAENQLPFIQLSAQSIADGEIVVDNLYTTIPSWLVLYSDEGGTPGEVIGNVGLTPGLFNNLSVPLLTNVSSTVLWAILHVDEEEIGVFNFPQGNDLPMMVNGQIVATSFTALQADREAESEEQTDSVKTFAIAGVNFAFSQTEIRVKKGDRVRIDFTSTDGFHDWVVDEFNAATEKVNTGESTSVEFVADQVGTFEYYCSAGQHRAMGMVGNLIVEE